MTVRFETETHKELMQENCPGLRTLILELEETGSVFTTFLPAIKFVEQ